MSDSNSLKKHCFSSVFWVGGAYFSRNNLVPLAHARISLEIGWSGWPGGVFLEKKAGLDGLGAYFLRKTIEKYVEIPFFYKKLKIHRFLINFFLGGELPESRTYAQPWT